MALSLRSNSGPVKACGSMRQAGEHGGVQMASRQQRGQLTAQPVGAVGHLVGQVAASAARHGPRAGGRAVLPVDRRRPVGRYLGDGGVQQHRVRRLDGARHRVRGEGGADELGPRAEARGGHRMRTGAPGEGAGVVGVGIRGPGPARPLLQGEDARIALADGGDEVRRSRAMRPSRRGANARSTMPASKSAYRTGRTTARISAVLPSPRVTRLPLSWRAAEPDGLARRISASSPKGSKPLMKTRRTPGRLR